MSKNKLPEREQRDKDLYWGSDIPFDDTVDDWTRIPAKELIVLLQKAIDLKEDGVINKGAYFKLRADEDNVEFQICVRQTPDDAAYAEIVAKWQRTQEQRLKNEAAAKEARELEIFKKLKAKYEPRTETLVHDNGRDITAHTLLHGAGLDQMRKDQMQEEMAGEAMPIINPDKIFQCYEKSWIAQARIDKPGYSVVDISAAGLLPLDMEHMRVNFAYDKLERGIVYVGHQHSMFGAPCTGIILKIEGEVPQGGVDVSINFIYK